MDRLSRHLSRTFFAGIVALLPIGGLIFTVVTLEGKISGPWREKLPFYFPGLGLILAIAIIYLIGLTVSTFLGKWAWRRIDSLLDRVPALGQLYQTLKQIVGYGEGPDAVFQQVVLIPARDLAGEELGLITNEFQTQSGGKVAVFVPGAPNPTAGRLLWLDPQEIRTIDLPVSEALKAMVTAGKVSYLGEEEGA